MELKKYQYKFTQKVFKKEVEQLLPELESLLNTFSLYKKKDNAILELNLLNSSVYKQVEDLLNNKKVTYKKLIIPYSLS